MLIARVFGMVLALLLSAGLASAQTAALNPTTLSFTASPDHATVIAGSAVLTRYEARFHDGTTLVLTTNLAKPTPDAANVISVPLTGSGLPKNRVLTAVVFAIGPGGSSGGPTSNPFAYLAAPGPVANTAVK